MAGGWLDKTRARWLIVGQIAAILVFIAFGRYSQAAAWGALFILLEVAGDRP
jgi:hypothetical protein